MVLGRESTVGEYCVVNVLGAVKRLDERGPEEEISRSAKFRCCCGLAHARAISVEASGASAYSFCRLGESRDGFSGFSDFFGPDIRAKSAAKMHTEGGVLELGEG